VQNLMRGLFANGLAGQLGMSEEQTTAIACEFVLRALREAPAREPALRAVGG
jgi:hypothetical protein